MANGLGSLGGTLTGDQLLTEMERLRREREAQLSASSQAAAEQAGQAQQTYQQAAGQPPPQPAPGDLFAQTLLGNLASVISQNPQYQQNVQTQRQTKQSDLLKARQDNLQSLRDVYMTKAKQAEEAADLEGTEKYRSKIDVLTRQIDILGQRQTNALALEEAKHRNRLAEITTRAEQTRQAGGGGEFNPADYVDTSESGVPFIDLSKIPSIKQRQEASDYARQNKIRPIGEREKSALDLVRDARSNIQSISDVVSTFLPGTPQERVLKGPANLLASQTQSNPDISSFQAYRTAAIQIIQALAGLGKGLRINQAEINAALKNDIPTITDTLPTAQKKLGVLLGMLGHVETAVLGQSPSPENSTPRSKATQADVDYVRSLGIK